ncbi:cilia- and flagella-associated protein 73 isoform X4 [Anser cygnoides]|uniref:cilia- and flagella-associated protein 73 isoform X4 n=1 Tax=Anser cygnoides TaxID=8845 RepID=UPI0034D18981
MVHREEEGGRAPQIALPMGLRLSRAPRGRRTEGDTSQGHVPGTRGVSPGCAPALWGHAQGCSRETPAGGSGRLRLPLATALRCLLPPSRLPGVPLLRTPAPKMSPGLEESLRRVFQEKLQLRTVPAWDSASLLPSSTRLLLKRREVAEVERALQAQREHPWAPQEFWQRMEGLDQRRQQLGQREEQLRDVALRFDAFLKVSAARRERALGRAGEEQARAAQRGAEADGLQQELAGLLRRRERLRRRLRGLRVFGDYLRGVVATTGQFQDVPSMLAHFGALAGVRAALLHQLEAGQQRLAQGQARLQRYHEEAGSELLRGRDEVLQLRARLEAARHDVLQGESCWTQIQSAATHKTLLLGQIRMAVLSLFQLATKHLKVPRDVALEDTETQLDVLWHQGPHLPRCCSACRTWLPSVLSCAPRSQGRAPHVCLPPPPLAHGTTGVSRCLRATSSPSLGTNPPGVRLPRPAWSCRTPAPT